MSHRRQVSQRPQQEPRGGETCRVGSPLRRRWPSCARNVPGGNSLALSEGIPGEAGGSQGGRKAIRDHLRGGHGLGAGPPARACFSHDVTSDFFFRLLAKKKALQPRRLAGVFCLFGFGRLCAPRSLQLTALGHRGKAAV